MQEKGRRQLVDESSGPSFSLQSGPGNSCRLYRPRAPDLPILPSFLLYVRGGGEDAGIEREGGGM